MGAEMDSQCARFVVTPNPAMSWSANKLFIGSLAFWSFGMAVVFALQGYWMILPFVGFELGFLTCVLYWCCWQSTRREVISIDAENIKIEVGYQQAEKLHHFQSAWTKVILYPPKTDVQQGRLVMRSKGEEVEVGAFLSNDERQTLAESIHEALISAGRPNCIT